MFTFQAWQNMTHCACTFISPPTGFIALIMDQVISSSPATSVLVWENRILPTPVLYITIVWGVVLLLTRPTQCRAMFFLLLGTAVLIAAVLSLGQIFADFFRTNTRPDIMNLTERLPEGSFASSWYMALVMQGVLIMAINRWRKHKNIRPSQQNVVDGRRYPWGVGVLLASLAYLYDPFATRLPKAVVDEGILLEALSLARPEGSRVSVSALASLSENSLSEPPSSELPLRHPARKKADKEVGREIHGLPPAFQTEHESPARPPHNAANEAYAQTPKKSLRAGMQTTPVPTQLWVLWRADSVDCITLLEQIAQHQKHFPDAWRHTRLMVINEGDDTLTFTRTLSRLQPLRGEILWDKQQQLLAALKLQVLPITLLLDAQALSKGKARVKDYRIGYTRF